MMAKQDVKEVVISGIFIAMLSFLINSLVAFWLDLKILNKNRIVISSIIVFIMITYLYLIIRVYKMEG